MGSKLKWIFGIAGGLVVAVIIAVLVLLWSYDYNALKPHIAKAVRAATGRELTIGGDIGLKISLTPTLVLTDVRFQNAAWGSRPDLAKVKRFEVQVSLYFYS